MTDYIDPIHGKPIRPAFNIPEIFGDAISYEDQIIALAKWVIQKLTGYNTKDEIKQIIETVNAAIAQIQDQNRQDIDDIRKLVEAIGKQQTVYNPTTGQYQDSQTVNRDMYRELAVHKATVAQLATLTCAEAAEYQCLEVAVLGDKAIFGHDDPKAIPIAER